MRITACILLLFISFYTTAQNNRQARWDSIRFSISAQAHKGFIIAHRDTLASAAKGAYPSAFEVSFSWLDFSQKGWRKTNRYAQNGILVGWVDFGKPDTLGTGTYFMLYMEPQLTFNQRLNFSITTAAGIIHLSHVYDLYENPTNNFFSNPVSAVLRVGIQGSFMITPHMQVSASANYNHISNGGTRVPNLGMNFPTGSISLAYHVRPSVFPKRKKTSDRDPNLRYQIQLFTASRLVMVWDANSERKPLVGLSFAVSRQFNHLSSWVAGSEFSYDASLPETGKVFGRKDDSPYILSLTGGHLLQIGRVGFSQILGLYVYKNYGNSKTLFQRYTLLYAVSSHVQLGFSLKAHADVAELVDLRLGVTF